MTEIMENEIPKDCMTDHPRLSSAHREPHQHEAKFGHVVEHLLTLLVPQICQYILVILLTLRFLGVVVVSLGVNVDDGAGHCKATRF